MMESHLSIIASITFAIATAWFVWSLSNPSVRTSVVQGAQAQLEEERRNSIRKANQIYRWFEPFVIDAEALNAVFVDSNQQRALAHALAFDPSPVAWKPLEYIACKQVEGALVGVVFGAVFLAVVGVIPAVGVGITVGVGYAYVATQSVKQQASNRVRTIIRRLPFAVDLMALLLEAGASFQDAMKTVVRENASHPLGAELGAVVSQIEMGRPRRLALAGFQARLQDQDVADLISAINKGEELGTPLSTIMRTQADQMRLKRSQWGERAAGEAEVRMTFPAMVVMLACMLLILGPFLLPPLLQMF